MGSIVLTTTNKECLGRETDFRKCSETSIVQVIMNVDGTFVVKKESKNQKFDSLLAGEFCTLSKFKKPYIRKVYNYVIGTRASFQMDYYLYTLLDKKAELTRFEKFIVIYGVSCAVETILNMGLIHRDIKPSNIMLNNHNYPVLSDFGIIRSNDRTQNSGKGTTIFRYPIFFDEDNIVNEYMDVYSIGILICDLFFGIPETVRNTKISMMPRNTYLTRYVPQICQNANDENDPFTILFKKCISFDDPIKIGVLLSELDKIYHNEFKDYSEEFSDFLNWLHKDGYDNCTPNPSPETIPKIEHITIDPPTENYCIPNQ